MNRSCFATLLVVFIFCQKAFSAVYYLSPTGNDSNTGSSLQPWKTFVFAVQNVSNGDEIIVNPGTYYETSIIQINGIHGLVIRAADPDNRPLIDFVTRSNNNRIVFFNACANITWDGINIINAGGVKNNDQKRGTFSFEDWGKTVASENHVIKNCEISYSWNAAVYSFHVSGVQLENLIIHNNAKRVGDPAYSYYKDHPHAIVAWHGDSWEIRECRIYENRGEGVGPYENCSGWLIEDNIVYDNHSVNIYLDSEKGEHVVRNNLVYNTGYMASLASDQSLDYGYKEAVGIRIANEIADWDFLGNYDPTKNKVYNIKVYNNIVLDCKGGIQAMQYANGYNFELYNSIIANNTIVNSGGGGGGIRLTVPGGVKFYNNVVVNTDQIISFSPDMKHNYISSVSPFIDGTGLDAQHYSLLPDATLCIDQGLDLSSIFTEDYFGTSRIFQGTAYDLGAIEFIQREIASTDQNPAELSEPYKIYPNPLRNGDVLVIEKSNEAYEGTRIQLYSVTGHYIFNSINQLRRRLEIPINGLQPGLYFIRINYSQPYKILVQ